MQEFGLCFKKLFRIHIMVYKSLKPVAFMIALNYSLTLGAIFLYSPTDIYMDITKPAQAVELSQHTVLALNAEPDWYIQDAGHSIHNRV